MTNNSNNNNQLLKNNDISPIPTKSHLITNTNNQINVKVIENENLFVKNNDDLCQKGCAFIEFDKETKRAKCFIHSKIKVHFE